VELLIRNFGRTKHALVVVRRDTHHWAARSQQLQMTMIVPA
jgi:hypothetical protein